jgi:hypothetical protein
VATNLHTTVRNATLSQLVTSLGGTSRLKLYTGSAPTKTSAPTGTLLATLTPAATAGVVATGVLTMNAIASDTSSAASGTPGYYRIIDGTVDDGTHTQAQGSAGVGSGDLNFTSTIASGGTTAVTSLVYTEGNA